MTHPDSPIYHATLGRLRRATLVLACAVSGMPLVGTAQAAAPEVAVTQVGQRAVGQAVVLEGSLQPVQQSTLSAQASGRIAQLQVKAGDRIQAGQVLAVIDDRMTQAGVNQAQAQLAQADAQLANAKASMARTRDLFAKGFVSQSALDVADTQLKAAVAASSGAQAGKVQSQLAQGFTRLTAPYGGWVLATHAQAGDLAAPGAPVLTVYAPQPMRAVVYMPASRQALALKASVVEVQLPGGRWVQPVSRVSLPVADAVSQTVEWRLDLSAEAAQGLVPGQQVQARFVSGEAKRLTVPADAVFRRGEMTAVYVFKGAQGANGTGAPADAGAGAAQPGFVLRAVRLGADHGAAGHEVLAGLQGGEWVALDPVRAGLQGARPASTQAAAAPSAAAPAPAAAVTKP